MPGQKCCIKCGKPSSQCLRKKKSVEETVEIAGRCERTVRPIINAAAQLHKDSREKDWGETDAALGTRKGAC